MQPVAHQRMMLRRHHVQHAHLQQLIRRVPAELFRRCVAKDEAPLQVELEDDFARIVDDVLEIVFGSIQRHLGALALCDVACHGLHGAQAIRRVFHAADVQLQPDPAAVLVPDLHLQAALRDGARPPLLQPVAHQRVIVWHEQRPQVHLEQVFRCIAAQALDGGVRQQELPLQIELKERLVVMVQNPQGLLRERRMRRRICRRLSLGIRFAHCLHTTPSLKMTRPPYRLRTIGDSDLLATAIAPHPGPKYFFGKRGYPWRVPGTRCGPAACPDEPWLLLG